MPCPLRPTLAEHAYTAYCASLATPQPVWRALPYRQRLAWSQAIHVGVCEAQRLPDDPPVLPVTLAVAEDAPAESLAVVITSMRADLCAKIGRTQRSLKGLSRTAGVDRRTLGRWLQGEDNVSVNTLLRLAEWLPTLRTD